MAFRVINATSWTQQCSIFYDNRTSDLVDQFGRPTTNLSAAWGITVEACYEFCGPGLLSQGFDFGTFAPAFTNFLLPWLALTAQLPYETSEWWTDVLSLCLALGSPALITFSLSVTILNRLWIKRQFKLLHREADRVRGFQRDFAYKLQGAQILLKEGQQAPLRVSTADGSLNDLLLQEKNSRWWHHVGKDLITTRRGVTSSLIAQIVVAVISWLFTIVISFESDLGDIETALQLASGSLLIWMIPVICGWIVVGTQRYTHSVNDTLEDIAFPITRTNAEGRSLQRGLVVKTGLNETVDIPKTLGIDITGDEGRQGPIFNYSRIFTWSRASSTLIDGFKKTARHQPTCPKSRYHQAKPPMDNEIHTLPPHTNSCPISCDCCSMPFPYPVNAYPQFSEIESGIWWRLTVATFFALLMQWGTTGAAILIAYLTPAVGLGCRSGAYTIYGVNGTIVWALHCISALLSHHAMVMHQSLAQKSSTDHDSPIKTPPTLSLYHRTIHALTILTDILGKSLAVINALWIVISNLLEYIGVYTTCWCQSDLIGLGRFGWVVLFKSAQEIAAVAGDSWRGGVAMGFLVCLASLMFFVLSCREERVDLSQPEW